MMQKQGHSLLLLPTNGHRVVSSTFEIVQILIQSYFELVISVLALEATGNSSHFSTAKEMSVKAKFFFV